MKTTLLLLFLGISAQLYSQETHLNRSNSDIILLKSKQFSPYSPSLNMVLADIKLTKVFRLDCFYWQKAAMNKYYNKGRKSPFLYY